MSLGTQTYVPATSPAGKPSVWNPTLGWVSGWDGQPLNAPRDQSGQPLPVSWNPGLGGYTMNSDGSLLNAPHTAVTPDGAGGGMSGPAWSPDMVVGDSYGGVQSADQARINSNRDFQKALIQAQQAAQRLALDEQIANNANELGNRKVSNEEQVTADAAKKNQDLIDLKKIASSDKMGEVGNAGTALAGTLTDTLDSTDTAKAAFDAAQSGANNWNKQLQQMVSSGDIAYNPKTKTYAASSSDLKAGPSDQAKQLAISANQRTLQEAQAVKAAADTLAASQRQLNAQIARTSSAGFTADPTTGTITHIKTGTSFAIPRKQSTQPALQTKQMSVRQFNPKTGTF